MPVTLEPVDPLKGEQIIAAEYHKSGKQSFAAVNPVSGAKLEPYFCEATIADVDSACRKAAADFDQIRSLSLLQRAEFLDNIADELIALGAELVVRANAETALPVSRLEGELTRTVNQWRLFAELVRAGDFVDVRIDRAMPDRTPVARPDIRSLLVPLGPVAVFGASNFPLAFSVAGGDTASAMAAGCPVIVKGHPAHPGTCELAGMAIKQAIGKCDVPQGVFSLLQASRHEVGAALVQHPLINAVAFTGSLNGGRALFDLASARPEPIPVYAEMGSANPVFLLPQMLAERHDALAVALAESMTLGVGQFCTAPGLIFAVKGAVTNRFLNSLAGIIAEKSPEVMLNDGIKQNFLAGLDRLQALEGVTRLGGRPQKSAGCEVVPSLLLTNASSLLAQPTVAAELFGPAVVVVVCESKTEMLTAAESLAGQLTASVHGSEQDVTCFRKLFDILERKAGRLIMNGFPTGVEVCSAMNHGGPYPATTDSRSTSVGPVAINRFLRRICYQGFPQELLPESVRDQNK